MAWEGKLEKINDYQFLIPKSHNSGMRVDGIIYADDKLISDIKKDNALQQVANVASLPGIVNYSLAMPDAHWGYGFCIGGVAATDPEKGGVISPGGVGFDINCGVRMLKTNLTIKDLAGKISKIADLLYQNVPSGLGSKGNIKLSFRQEQRLITEGAAWLVKSGMGVKQDLECCEENGAIEGADPDSVSERAYERGRRQIGTLGSGNHFVEVCVIDEVFDDKAADKLGMELGQIAIMIHSGSRGFGYQICDDYTRSMAKALLKYGINVPDRQLACAPINSPEARSYIGAMRAAANYAWANRHALMHLVRESFAAIFVVNWQSLGMELVYDVAHNIAKFEKYVVDGKEKELCIHRKGATRALGPGNINLPDRYKDMGQPVIIPGDMGRASYLLLGTKKAEQQTFGSTCHGAGRLKSRHNAVKTLNIETINRDLKSKGIEIRAAGRKTILEEAPQAYKDISDVIGVVSGSGISSKILRTKPLCVIKG